MIRKNIYKWHRTLSLIIALPVCLWALSGFMHPLMTNIRPHLSTQKLDPEPISPEAIKISLKDCLKRNNISAFSNFRIVTMGGNWFYQVQLPEQMVLRYFSTQTGRPLKNGDELYARHLARQFLNGPKKKEPNHTSGLNTHDCCDNTTSAIINDKSGAPVKAVQLIDRFDEEYKYINRLLPAYRVSFDKADSIRVYVETAHDRFAFAMDNKRAVFDQFFSLFHTLGWLDLLGKGKLIIEILIMLAAFISTLMGIYIFCISKSKKGNGNGVAKARYNHRWTSILIALFTLLFTGSGAYHALQKFSPDLRDRHFAAKKFQNESAEPDWEKIQNAVGRDKVISNISIAAINGVTYWQIFILPGHGAENNKTMAAGKDLMTGQEPSATIPLYVQANNYSLLAGGDEQYARNLAGIFSKHHPSQITGVEMISKFEDEYGFVNKRLPVWRIRYADNSHERYYVETCSGKLAARVDDRDLIEGYSFALFHKHHFMDWAGKTARDISTMFWALAQVAMVVVGLILYFKVRKRKRMQTAA